MSIKAVIFDVGGVLHKSNTVVADSLSKELDLDKTTYEAIWANQIPLLGSGKIDEAAFWTQVHERYGVRPVTLEEDLLGKAFAEALEPYTEILNLVQDLHRQGITLAILSNTIEPHAKALRGAGYYNNFDKVFLSHEIGMRKPDPAIYTYVLQELGVGPHEAVFIDDDPVNVVAAQSVGMRGIVFESPTQVVADVQALVPTLAK